MLGSRSVRPNMQRKHFHFLVGTGACDALTFPAGPALTSRETSTGRASNAVTALRRSARVRGVVRHDLIARHSTRPLQHSTTPTLHYSATPLLPLSPVILNFCSAGARQRISEKLDKVVHGGRGFGHFSPHQKHFKLLLRAV
jgi:hypothetical protein